MVLVVEACTALAVVVTCGTTDVEIADAEAEADAETADSPEANSMEL